MPVSIATLLRLFLSHSEAIPFSSSFFFNVLYERFITETGINEKKSSPLLGLNIEDVNALNRVAAEVQESIGSGSISSEIQSAIAEACSQFCEESAVGVVPVAVRWSSTAEDLPTASFAGQQEIYLWVAGARL